MLNVNPAVTVDDHKRSLSAALDLVGGRIRDYSGIRYSRAKELLDSALAKGTIDQSYDFRFLTRLTNEEAQLWDALVTCPKPSAEILTQDELYEQFADCLVDLGLLNKTEAPAFAAISDWLAVYAVSRMHNAHILRVKGGERLATLEAITGTKTGKLSVYAVADWGHLHPIRELFSTNCDPAQWCAPELLDAVEEELGDDEFEVVMKLHWDFAIRLNDEGTLIPRRDIYEATVKRSVYVRERPKGRA